MQEKETPLNVYRVTARFMKIGIKMPYFSYGHGGITFRHVVKPYWQHRSRGIRPLLTTCTKHFITERLEHSGTRSVFMAGDPWM